MKKNPFLSKEINPKRIWKGIGIVLPLTIILFIVGNYSLNLIDNSLREHYLNKQENEVLGTKEESTFEVKYASEIEEITKMYGVDEYKHNWNKRIEDYYHLNSYIKTPTYYLSGKTAELKQEWILNGGYKLELNCPPQDLETVIPGEYYSCLVTYNGKPISENVRYYISSPTEGKTGYSVPSLVVYSPESYASTYGMEFVIVGTYESGSYDSITVFNLEEGNAIRIPFLYQGEYKDNWFVSSPMYFEFMYSQQGDIKLLTQFHNPATGFVNIYRIWNLENDSFVLEKTIGDITE